MRALAYEQAIPRRSYPETISSEQRRVQFELEQQFVQAWNSLRPKLDEVIARDPSQRLSSFREAADASIEPGGVLWGFGRRLYDHATEQTASDPISDDEIKMFIDVCPPFRAACYALVMAWFNYSLGPTHDRFPRSGRNDLMMAAYLPYCDRFITQDFAQRRDLAEIAVAAKLHCEVAFFDEFRSSFSLVIPNRQ